MEQSVGADITSLEHITLNLVIEREQEQIVDIIWEDQQIKADFYRYVDGQPYGCRPSLEEFVMIKETPKGYWITEKYYHFIDQPPKRWISKSAYRKFAYPTKEEALYSYYRRKLAQLKIMERRIDNVKDIVAYMENYYKKHDSNKNDFLLKEDDMKL